VLGYKYFPNSPIPIPPVWSWLDMDTMINILILKMRKQAEAAKKVLAYESHAAKDAERLAGAADNATAKVDNIESVKAFEWGGVNPESYNWVNYIESQFSIQGGNLYTMGGRNVQAETLGQEQMLMSNASRFLDKMVNSVYNFTEKILRKRLWFLWTDPLVSLPEIKRIQGVGEVKVLFDQAAKEGDFYDFNFKVKPYSMQRFNPQMADMKLSQFLTQWILPILPMAMQQGWQLDVNQATEDLAKLKNIDISGWWKSGVPAQTPGAGTYAPQQGTVKPKSAQGDDRFGASPASREANLQQQQSRAGGKSSKEVVL